MAFGPSFLHHCMTFFWAVLDPKQTKNELISGLEGAEWRELAVSRRNSLPAARGLSQSPLKQPRPKRAHARALVFGLVLPISCAQPTSPPRTPLVQSRPSSVSSQTPSVATPAIRIIFRDGKVYARSHEREWPIAEVGRDEMLWAPEGDRFAYIKEQERPLSLPPKRRKRKRGRVKQPLKTYRIVIRNIYGDSVNEFPVYRPGRPINLDWITSDRIGYQAPPDKTGDAYVVHSVETGEILNIYRGQRFIWSPGRRALAYIAGKPGKQVIKVGGRLIWPRQGTRACKGRRCKPFRRTIIGDIVWSRDANGLAFREKVNKQAYLVVLLVLDNQEGDMNWPLPKAALASDTHLFWGNEKVFIGQSILKPQFAASWRRTR